MGGAEREAGDPGNSSGAHGPNGRDARRLARALLVWRRPALWSAAWLPLTREALERRAAALEAGPREHGFRAEPVAGLRARLRTVLRGDHARMLDVAHDLYTTHASGDRAKRHVGALDAAASFLWALWASRALRQGREPTSLARGEQADTDHAVAEVAALALARLIAGVHAEADCLSAGAAAGARAALPLLLAGDPVDDTGWVDYAEGIAHAVSLLRRPPPGPADALPAAERAGARRSNAPPAGHGMEQAASLVVAPGAAEAIKRLAGQDRHRLEPFKALARPIGLPPIPAGEAGEAALRALGAEMPNFGAALARVRGEVALLRHVGAGSLRLRPLLLVGPPGVGKSRFARRLAAALGLAHAAFSLAGASDNRALEGTAAGWSTAAPCWPASEIERLGTAGPLLLVDEADKTRADGRNGDPLQTLFDWLEPGTARAVRDPVLGAPVDLSRISWLLCANDAARLPAPLLGRVGIVRVEEPPIEAFGAVLRGVLADLADEFGARPAMLPALDAAEVAWLEAQWRRHRVPRLLRKLAERLLAQAAERTPPEGTPLN